MRLTPSAVPVLQVLKGKVVRLPTDAEVPVTGYNTPGVKRVVFFDSGKRFNPSWPTQLMKDTFTEMGWHFFSDELEPWVFEEGTITQQPDAIHCADHVLSGINALLQAEDVRYCRNIDLAHINMASQRLRWLQPFLWVTVEVSQLPCHSYKLIPAFFPALLANLLRSG
ncbi:hypothetical protein V8C86DRAFT_2445140 [Haematococcus lacustris]